MEISWLQWSFDLSILSVLKLEVSARCDNAVKVYKIKYTSVPVSHWDVGAHRYLGGDLTSMMFIVDYYILHLLAWTFRNVLWSINKTIIVRSSPPLKIYLLLDDIDRFLDDNLYVLTLTTLWIISLIVYRNNRKVKPKLFPRQTM